MHWIVHVTKVLVVVSNSPAADDRTKEKLQEHACWIISVLSWIPDNEEAISFVETYQVTELLFEAALDAVARQGDEVSKITRELLISWAFKAGRYQIGWAILQRSMCALATLALWKDDLDLVPWLRADLTKRLGQPGAPDQELRDRAARELRDHAANQRRPEFEIRRIEHAMGEIEPGKLRPLLLEIANLLSPETANDPVRRHRF